MYRKLNLSLAFLAMLFFTSVAIAADIVNLNKASAAAIQQNLVGIGPIKAEAIVSYRKKNGKFNSIDDLQNVKGLGPALIKKNKRYLSLSKGAVSGDDKAYAAAKKQAGKAKSTQSKKKPKNTAKNTKKKDKSTKPAKNKPSTEKPTKKKPSKKPAKKPKKKEKKKQKKKPSKSNS